jgi:hypothetical protein
VSNKQIQIFDDGPISVRRSTPNIVTVQDRETRVIEVHVPGFQGAKGEKGDRGETGFSGAGEPFFVITSGSLYATTASIALFAISSSLLPFTSSGDPLFTLGELERPWYRLYVSESITFVRGGIELLDLKAGSGFLSLGNTRVSTSSFGFLSGSVRHEVIHRRAADQQTLSIRSGSINAATVNTQGVFSIGDFDYLPSVVAGAIIKSGSDFYFGV